MITIKNMGALDVAATANEFVRNARRLADAIKVARDPEVQGKLAEDAEMSAAFERYCHLRHIEALELLRVEFPMLTTQQISEIVSSKPGAYNPMINPITHEAVRRSFSMWMDMLMVMAQAICLGKVRITADGTAKREKGNE
jgi:hypothetical protein